MNTISYTKPVNVTHATVVVDSHSAFHNLWGAELHTETHWHHLIVTTPLTHFLNFCGTIQETRKSGKVSFMTKITSAVSDYAMHYDLLHYNYDCWLFKTIIGAINSAKQAQGSPATALEAKTFSHQYWANQHHYLIDAVRQFGFPSMFITISPFEWSFPFPPWLNNLRNQTGKGPTELAIPETIHITHVLEQYIQPLSKSWSHWRPHRSQRRALR